MSAAQHESSTVASPRAGRILSIDYGRRRIGLAISDESGTIARPLATLERRNRDHDLRRLGEIIRGNEVRVIVVGRPVRLDGMAGEMAAEADRFATRLARTFGVRVEHVDERLTSREAEEMMAKELSGRKRRGAGKKRAGAVGVDAVAAAVILRDYLARGAERG